MWPVQWRSETDLPFRVGMTLFAAALVVVGVVSFVSQTDLSGAVLAAIGVLLAAAVLTTPGKRKPVLSEKIRLVDLDPVTGVVTDTTGPVGAGRVRGVLVPADPSARIASLSGYGALALTVVIVWPAAAGQANTVVAILVAVVAVLILAIAVTGIAKTIGNDRNDPKIVFTPAGLWFNDRAHGVMVEWDAIEHVIPSRKGLRRPAVGLSFVDGYRATRVTVFTPSLEATSIRRDEGIIVDTTPLLLDAALILLTVELAAAREDIRTGCEDPDDGVLTALRDMYANWAAEPHRRQAVGDSAVRWARTERGVFADPPVPLAPWQLERAVAGAQRAARRSRGSVTHTGRRHYRRYRQRTNDTVYLDWPRWRRAYLREYRAPTIGRLHPPEMASAAALGGMG